MWQLSHCDHRVSRCPWEALMPIWAPGLHRRRKVKTPAQPEPPQKSNFNAFMPLWLFSLHSTQEGRSCSCAHNQRLPLALSGHRFRRCECPLLGVKRTSPVRPTMSAYDPKRTSSGLLKNEPLGVNPRGNPGGNDILEGPFSSGCD